MTCEPDEQQYERLVKSIEELRASHERLEQLVAKILRDREIEQAYREGTP